MEGVDTADFAFALKGIMAQRLIKIIRKDIREYLENYRGGDIEPSIKKLFENGTLWNDDLGLKFNELIGDHYFPLENKWVYDGLPEIFEGRTAITEFWKVGSKAQDLIFDNRFSTSDLLKISIEEDGMLPMAITGIEKIVKGHTSISNVIKIVGVDAIRHNRKIIRDMFFQ
jgi:type II secretory ATPase GspE/PulE/Tfp pilus assembly ATPase PilB-like protein